MTPEHIRALLTMLASAARSEDEATCEWVTQQFEQVFQAREQQETALGKLLRAIDRMNANPADGLADEVRELFFPEEEK